MCSRSFGGGGCAPSAKGRKIINSHRWYSILHSFSFSFRFGLVALSYTEPLYPVSAHFGRFTCILLSHPRLVVFSRDPDLSSSTMATSPLARYESFLISNASTISTIESSLRSLTWFLPGRFRDAELGAFCQANRV